MYRYTDGGLRNVWLANGYEVKQPPLVRAWHFITLIYSAHAKGLL